MHDACMGHGHARAGVHVRRQAWQLVGHQRVTDASTARSKTKMRYMGIHATRPSSTYGGSGLPAPVVSVHPIPHSTSTTTRERGHLFSQRCTTLHSVRSSVIRYRNLMGRIPRCLGVRAPTPIRGSGEESEESPVCVCRFAFPFASCVFAGSILPEALSQVVEHFGEK